MADLSLQLDPALQNTQGYHDLSLVGGDLVLTRDADTRGTHPVTQQISQRLRFFQGEFFMDKSQGVPWLQRILVKGTKQGDIDAILQTVILKTPGVLTLLRYSASVNAASRSVAVTAQIQTATGVIDYASTYAVGQGYAS